MEDGKIDPLHPPFDLLEVAKAMAISGILPIGRELRASAGLVGA